MISRSARGDTHVLYSTSQSHIDCKVRKKMIQVLQKTKTNNEKKNTAQVNAGSGADYELRWEIGTPH
jgi:hypothetical protein